MKCCWTVFLRSSSQHIASRIWPWHENSPRTLFSSVFCRKTAWLALISSGCSGRTPHFILFRWTPYSGMACARPPHLPFILDEERNSEEVVRLLLNGAHGFLPHSQVGMRLGRAARFVSKGHFWVGPGIFESYLTQMRKGSSDARQVTPRESEILDLLRLRLSNKEIAGYLRIRVSTVKFHVTHILSKLQISSRQDLFTDDFRGTLSRLSPG